MILYPHIKSQSELCLGLLALSIAFFGCSSEDSPASAAGTWTITGKTALIGAVNPLSGITVRCSGQSTISGPDGSYELRGVPEGTQTVSAEGPNCKPYSKSIEVRADTRHFIYLDFNGTTLSGYVGNMIDGPIQGATVKIGLLSDQTDQAGHYTITDVPLKSDSIIVTHTRYYSAQSFITAAGPDTRLDFLMQRDTVLTERITTDQYVDEGQPNATFLNTRLMLATNGYIGAIYYSNIRRYIYLTFDFPAFMKDPRVTLLEGSLELCTDGSYAAISCYAYALTSPWFYYTLTFNQQPAHGSQLTATSFASVNGPQYLEILTPTTMQQLLENYRRDGLISGVVIQAQSPAGGATTRSFYSVRSLINPPRLTFKVRF